MNFDKKTFLISFAVLLVLILFSVLYYLPKLKAENAFYFKEDPLKKNTGMGLKGGEVLKYRHYYAGNQQEEMNITYRVLKNFDCISIEVLEFKSSSGCIDQNGNDKNRSNLSLSNQFVDFYYPWMLAVDEDWTWRVRRVSSVGGEVTLDTYLFSSKGIELVNGVPAYRIELNLDREDNVTIWVDMKRRISLKRDQNGFISELIEPNN